MRRSYGWVIVGAGALMGCVAIGAMFSLAVFLQPMSDATGWSRTGISSAMTLDFLTMGIAAFGWGALTDRFGPRIVTSDTRNEMKKMLDEIKDGTYARKWISENENGRPWFNKMRSSEQEQLLERVGVKLRAMMPFLNPVTVKPDMQS